MFHGTFLLFYIHIEQFSVISVAQSAGAVEYTDCTTVEG